MQKCGLDNKKQFENHYLEGLAGVADGDLEADRSDDLLPNEIIHLMIYYLV